MATGRSSSAPKGSRISRRRGAGRRRNPAGGAYPRTIEGLRRAIDRIDLEMVALLNRRASHAMSIGTIKHRRKLPVYQPAREEEILGNVQRLNSGPLENTALRRLFERIIDESRRLERVAVDGITDAARDEGAVPLGEPGSETD